jgi:hypothetical protein
MTQPVQQRLAPLRWMMTESSSVKETGLGVDPMTSLSSVIFGKDRQAFIDLLLQAGRDTRASSSIASGTLQAIRSMQNPESAAFLLAVFDAAPDSGHLFLLKGHLDDPRVLKRLEQLAVDADSPLQGSAAGIVGAQP